MDRTLIAATRGRGPARGFGWANGLTKSNTSDVIPRVQDHPKRRLDELLPGPLAQAGA
jgi:hypothetical protein